MKSIIVDFSKIYIGTVAKQGEHNRTQLVFALPDDFAGADYINAEFKKSDNSDVVVEGVIPKDGFITIPLTQGLTNVCDQIDIQLVAYAVDGVEITKIAKSSTVRGVIRPSLNILFNHDEPGIIERIIAFVNMWGGEKLPEMWEKKHWHDNKRLLDSLIADDIRIKPNWDVNDAENKNYIANRTHWEESSIVSNDYTVDWLAETPPYSPQNWDCLNLDISLEEDVEYTLIADGQTITGTPTKIELDVGYIQKHLVIGNLSYLNGLTPSGETYEDNGFPMLLDFATEYVGNQDTFNLILTNEDYFGNDLAFSVGKEETVYHPLSMDYMPDGVEDSVEKKHAHENKQEIDKIGVAKTHGGSYGFDIVTYNNSPISQYSLWTLSSDGNGVVEGSLYAGDITTVFAVFGEPIVSITITELMNPLHMISEYNLHFTSGAAAPTVVLPASVQWVVEPTFEKYKHYQISIVDNIALWCAVDIEAKEEES